MVAAESGLAPDRVRPLVELAGRLRALKGHDLEEGVSTRLIVYCATLVAAGVSVTEAVLAGMIEPLTDDADDQGCAGRRRAGRHRLRATHARFA